MGRFKSFARNRIIWPYDDDLFLKINRKINFVLAGVFPKVV